jgi:FkbH-like protein
LIKADDAAEVRLSDLKANENRQEFLDRGFSAYIEEAQPRLLARIDSQDDLPRLVDLGQRSNQFNLALLRWKATDLALPDRHFVALSLHDRFSDSGVIGGIFLTVDVEKNHTCVNELFLSCRVLGRGLETALIMGSLREFLERNSLQTVEFSWRIGPRNQPGLTWLTSLKPELLIECETSATFTLDQIIALAIIPEGVSLDCQKE